MAQEILISINVNSGKAEANLGNAKQSVDKLAAAQKRLKEAESATAIEIAKVNIQVKEQIAANNQAAAALLKNTQNGSKQFRTQVGLNNAILQEAGRAASDARFGFNGVANNVGQLASLFGSLINTSDNVVTSLKNLGKSLLGTGGILIAVQLLIAYGDRIYNFFFNASSAAAELSKKMKGLLEPISQNRLELLGYTEVLKDSTSSEEARIEALNELAKVVPDAIDDNGNLKVSYQELQAAVEDYIEQLTIRAEIEAIIDLNSEKFSKRRKVRALEAIEDEDERNKAIKKYLDEEIGFFEASGRSRAEQRKFDRLSEEEQNKIRFASLKKRTEAEAQQVLDSVVELQKKLKGVRDEDEFGSGRSKSLRAANKAYFSSYELRLKYFDRYAEKALKKEEKFLKRSEIQNLDVSKKQAIRELDIVARNETEKEKVRYQAYIESVELRKQNLLDQISSKESELLLEAKTEKEKQDIRNKASLRRGDILNQFVSVATEANKRYSQSLDQIKNSFADATMSIIDSYGNMQDELVNQQILDDLSAFGLEAIKGIQDRLKAQRSASEERSEQLMIEQALLDSQYEFERNALDQKISLAEAEGEAYEALIQKKKNLDASYAEETAAINLETDRVVLASKLSVFTETANMLDAAAALAKEGSDLAKGLALTALATNTAVSMIQGFRLAQEASQGTGPAAPFIAAATYIQQITTLLSAVSRAKNILSSGKTDGVSASAASVTVQAPDFNVVGASSVDQLAQTVAGQTNEPIKAYVVGKDVTNQQELDRNIVNTAGI